MNFNIGDQIEVGDQRGISASAVGLVFKVFEIDEDNPNLLGGTIVKNPNGWPSERVYHEYDPRYDKLLSTTIHKNEDALFLLNKEDAI